MSALVNFMTTDNLLFLLQGAGKSLLLAACALFFGLIFGILGAAAKISKHRILRIIGNIYVELIRGTPMLLQILFLYIAFPVMMRSFTGQRFIPDPYICGAVAMSINSGAYSTELIRSGINGVDKGQWEACKVLGLSYGQTMKLVILPQAFKRIIPPIVSEFITLIKDSSLISVLGATELLYSAQILGANTFNLIPPLLMSAVLYLIMTLATSYLARRVERRFAISD
ncbi:MULTISPECIES: amino acid ABC transporter permease [Coprobacillaceae]|uniref:amino acid ABC transporter permease n=1 Tax=Coprobacillaceae TaxID=2810280 RepID=UPI000E4ED346|nr:MULTISPECIES: amino acid ABC transporter permease [Coprobacillaceae]RHM62603.1 amino acid ABC transporter permease [Coprobacillus sp. AF33-1AC]RHS93421.1 amino acid ABC transporter permease [Erysipelatoclostridium sp. AM42-17]